MSDSMRRQAGGRLNKIQTKKMLFVGTLSLIVALVSFGLFASLHGLPLLNRAEEIARPLEQTLVDAGGNKKTAGGDGGHGIDNSEPYYDTTYEMPLDKTKTVVLINEIAEKNGYKLTHASPTNRGHLGAVADIYISAWYFDNSSKQSSFPDLTPGPIKLAFKVGDEDKAETTDKTSVRISVRMPQTKR